MYEEKLRAFTVDMGNAVKASLERNAASTLTITNGPLSIQNIRDKDKESIEGMHATTKACETDMGMMRQINTTCSNISDDSNGGMVYARTQGFLKFPGPLKGERDLTLGLFWRDPDLAASVVAVGRK